jgi:hypothetical protein
LVGQNTNLILEQDWIHYGNRLSCFKKHIRRTPPNNKLQQQQPLITPKPPPNKFLVCLCVPLHSTNIETFLSITLPTLVQTTHQQSSNTLIHHIHIFVAYEWNDDYFTSTSNFTFFLQSTQQILNNNNNATTTTTTNLLLYSLTLHGFPYVEQDLVYLWNMLFLESFEQGCDYFHHITSDVDFASTPGVGMGWMNHFIQLLLQNDNIGMIGNELEINTMPFVSRTHLSAFHGIFYPRILKNVWADTSLFAFYNHFKLLLGPSTLGHWINLSDEGEFDLSNKTTKRMKNSTRLYKNCDVDVRMEPQTREYILQDLNPNFLKQYVLETFHGQRLAWTLQPTKKPTSLFPERWTKKLSTRCKDYYLFEGGDWNKDCPYD